MLSEDVGAGVLVADISRVKPFQVAEIPKDVIIAEREMMQDARETVGFSRNEFGEFSPGSGDTTATEAQIVKMASEIRVDERRDMVADMLVDVIHDIHRVIFNHWGQEQVIELIGPAGVPIWVHFTGTELKDGRYEVKVDPDTAIPETKALREQRAVQAYQLLKTNPIVDPFKLTAYLLHELHGVQFDDMLRVMPPGVGSQQNPMSVGQYGGLLQRVSQAGVPAQQQTGSE